MKNFAKKYAFLTVFLLLVISHGCGGGTSGTTNINGNVGSVTARGNFEGITVLIEEDTKFSTITNDSGIFELLNIPSGNPVTLAFILNNKTARISLETPSNTTITLKNISLNFSTGVASVSEIISNPSDDDTENNSSTNTRDGSDTQSNATGINSIGGGTTGDSSVAGGTTGNESSGVDTSTTTTGGTTGAASTTGGTTESGSSGVDTSTTGGTTGGGSTTGGNNSGTTTGQDTEADTSNGLGGDTFGSDVSNGTTGLDTE